MIFENFFSLTEDDCIRFNATEYPKLFKYFKSLKQSNAEVMLIATLIKSTLDFAA